MGILLCISRAVVIILMILATHSAVAVTVKQAGVNKVLLLSVSGLRPEYFKDMKNIKEMIASGTQAKFVENAANVLELVTHFSVVTGLYPESHGIVSNIMYDPDLKRVFDSKTRADPEWWVNVHPVWQEIESQGRGLSALCHWPGVYGPMKSSSLECQPQGKESMKSDIEQAAQWFESGVKLVLMYSGEIKKAALKWGPFSQQVLEELKKFDSNLIYLLKKSKDLNVNILLTSESGVTDLQWNHVIDLDQCITPESYVITQPQATLLIYPKYGHSVQELHQNLTKCPHLQVFLKEELPPRFHFSKNERIPPLVAFVPLGAVVRSSHHAHQKTDEQLSRMNKGEPVIDMGGKGYHPDYEVMQGIFIGYGQSFKPGLKFQPIKTVDIYGLLCHLLGVEPKPNNGSYDVITAMFATSFANDVISNDVNSTYDAPRRIVQKGPSDLDVHILFWFLVVTTALLVLFCCVGCLTTMHTNYKHGCTNTRVYEPGAKKLLANDSSDED